MAKSRDAQETRIVNGRELNLKKLSRTELLELLLEQTKELEATQAKVSELEKALADRKIEMEQAGSIAEAALQLNKVFEAAQQAADDYVLSVTGKHITELPEKDDDSVKSEEAPEEGEEKTEEAPEEKPEESQEEEDEDGDFWDTEVPEEELEEPIPDPDAAEQSPEQMEIEYEDLRADKAQERP
jgi:cell division septation protein DedD